MNIKRLIQGATLFLIVISAPTFAIAQPNYVIPRAKVTAPKGNDADGMERVKSVVLEFSSPRLGKKSLYMAEYKSDDMYVSPLDVAVAGVFKSPFENRVAVVMINVERGWEGPPHTVDIRIAGADLVTGFRK